MTAAEDTSRDWFPIRVVSQRTGVNTVTLRAWERRYGLLQPMRTAKGHRLYSIDDIERVGRIVEWLARGVPISRVGVLLARSEPLAEADVAEVVAGGSWADCQARLRQAAAAFDEARLDEGLNEAFGLYPFPVIAERLLAPLLAPPSPPPAGAPGDEAGAVFLRAFLRRKLAARLLAGARHLQGPPVLLAALDPAAGDGLPLYTVAAACQALEMPVLVLDEPLPPTELLVVAASRPPLAILLLGEAAHDVHDLQRRLSRLASGAGAVPVLLAGASARIHEALARGCRVEPLPGQAPAEIARRLVALLPEHAP